MDSYENRKRVSIVLDADGRLAGVRCDYGVEVNVNMPSQLTDTALFESLHSSCPWQAYGAENAGAQDA